MQQPLSDLQTSPPLMTPRRLPIGAEVMPAGGVHFRVWAPRCRRLAVVFEPCNGAAVHSIELAGDGQGYFQGASVNALAGMRYRFCLDGADALVPDPASRFQPEGPHGPSEIVDPNSFKWTDENWRGIELSGQVIYELHLGAFTAEGNLAAAARQLEVLKDLGVTLVEIMPVNEFAGEFGWGYDGVALYALSHLYGRPDDFRGFVDHAHELGLGVILDVVYNHLGPDGNYLDRFSNNYFSRRHRTDWGEAINFDGSESAPVREFFRANAGYWIDEYHLDGLRLDATQNIYDDSSPHILAEIAEQVRKAAGQRKTLLIAENELQQVKLVRPADLGGYGLDGLWNDDFHHSARVALTGEREAYYMDYLGTPQELISTVKRGYLYQGQWFGWQGQGRGTATRGLWPGTLINYLENHDQICNSGFGARIHFCCHPGSYRAMTALLLLAPATPLLFMGQEFGASSPFVFFADHKPELAKLVYQGRLQFVGQFPSLATPESQANIPDPSDRRTFEACKLKLEERFTHGEIYQLHRDLLALRRDDPVFRSQGAHGVDGAVLGAHSLVLRFFGSDDSGDRLLLVNLGVDQRCEPMPEPLLAPPEGGRWEILWSSERPAYGGRGTPQLADERWQLPGNAALVLASVKA